MEKKKEKTIFNLELHKTLFIEESIEVNGIETSKKYEVTRVPGGWVYSFEYPGWRQQRIVFVPLAEYITIEAKKNEK